MSTFTSPGGVVGASFEGEVRPRPTHREIESFLLRFRLSGAMRRRIARRVFAAPDPYREAARVAESKTADARAVGAPGYNDPAGRLAAIRADEPVADSQCDFYAGRVIS